MVHNVTFQVSSIVFHNVTRSSRELKWAVTSALYLSLMSAEFLTTVRRLVSSVQWTVLAGWRRRGWARARVLVTIRRARTRGLRILSDQLQSSRLAVIGTDYSHRLYPSACYERLSVQDFVRKFCNGSPERNSQKHSGQSPYISVLELESIRSHTLQSGGKTGHCD